MQKLARFGGAAAWLLVLFFLAMIRVFLDPRLYAVPGAARAVSTEESYADTRPIHDPIPEAVPSYDPAQYPAPNPYEAQPAAYADPYAQNQGYNEYAQPPYADPYAAQVGAVPYQSEYETAVPQNAYAGNAAVDLVHNPYATGEVQAGSLNSVPPNTPPHS